MLPSRFCGSIYGAQEGRFHIILKGSRIFGWSLSIGFNLNSPAALAFDKRVSLSFEARP